MPSPPPRKRSYSPSWTRFEDPLTAARRSRCTAAFAPRAEKPARDSGDESLQTRGRPRRPQLPLDRRGFPPTMLAPRFRLGPASDAAAPRDFTLSATYTSRPTTLNTSPNTSHLIAPHGGELINLILDREQAADIKAESRDLPPGTSPPAKSATSRCSATAASRRSPAS